MRQPTNTSVREGVSDTLLHCVVKNARGALVQWFQNGFGLGFDRDLPGWQRYRYDGSVALGTSVCAVVNVVQKTYMYLSHAIHGCITLSAPQ